MATRPPAKPAAAPAKEEAAAAPPPKSKKLLIFSIVFVLLAVLGGAVWYFTQGDSAESEPAADKKEEAVLEAKFVPLGDNFTVNLQREEGDQYLQVGITLKILQPELEEKIKVAMPEIRSKLLFLLSGKFPSELQSAEGKKKLVAEIIVEVDSALGIAAPVVEATAPEAAPDQTAASAVAASAPAPDPQPAVAAAPKTTGVVDVLFTSFIIQ